MPRRLGWGNKTFPLEDTPYSSPCGVEVVLLGENPEDPSERRPGIFKAAVLRTEQLAGLRLLSVG